MNHFTTSSDDPVIVTGAGSGLGRAVVQAFARANRPTMLIGRREEALLETLASCQNIASAGWRSALLSVDLLEPSAAERIVSETLTQLGSICGIVNNAGLARFAGLEQAELADWQSMLGTNLLAPATLIRHAAPALRQSHGVVINIASIGGLLALPQRALYGASKAALLHLTRSLARELAPYVRVNAVVPGAIDTSMYNDLGLDASQVHNLRAELVRTTPLGRMGTVEDVVPWIEMLLGAAGRWVTGSLIVIDGGRSC